MSHVKIWWNLLKEYFNIKNEKGDLIDKIRLLPTNFTGWKLWINSYQCNWKFQLYQFKLLFNIPSKSTNRKIKLLCIVTATEHKSFCERENLILRDNVSWNTGELFFTRLLFFSNSWFFMNENEALGVYWKIFWPEALSLSRSGSEIKSSEISVQ